ncbi:hypothetical protein ACQP1P_11980 [Dactylosporangium sp. CA-052675]|uniref:hypothetical protein n=1 Tax=Dactylosporangium sp. CA-052675 TaxID=3239927 RepID=UPI003D8C62E8
MAEHDVTRELVRRAYAGEPFDAEAGLAEVVRRAGRPPADGPEEVIERRHTVNVRRRRRVALAGVFAGVVGLVLVIGVATGRLGGGFQDASQVGLGGPSLSGGHSSQWTTGGLPTDAWPSGGPTPSIGGGEIPGGPSSLLPSQCAVGMHLKFENGQFTATDAVGTCPPLDPKRIWLLDDHSNGLLFPGSGTVWPTVTTGTTISPPFTFTVPSITALQEHHAYELYYLPADVHPAPGQDASPVLQHAMMISGPVVP